jgi:Tol biopolymer transport system component
MAVVLVGCGPSSPAEDAEPVGEIAFSGWDGKRHAIHLVRTDGSGVEEVARGTDGGPVWSPDGKQLAFVRCDPVTEGDCTVFVQEDDIERQVTRIDYGNPAWSPDGTEIALVRCDDTADDACAVFTMPADGGTPRRVTRNGVFGQPVWSPDGRHIALDGWTRGIVVVAADGSGISWSTHGLFDSDPNWSPDGRLMAFVRSEGVPGPDVRHDIYVIEADGTGARRMTDGETSSSEPTWSPDGTQLAFAQWAEAGECPKVALFVADRNQTSVRRSTPHRPLHADPTWSPDAREIAFTRIEECWSEDEATLWVLTVETGKARPISPGVQPDAGLDFAWRPAD